MYTVRFILDGRTHLLSTDVYATAVMAAQAVYDCVACDTVEIWQGLNLLWRDNVPEEVGA